MRNAFLLLKYNVSLSFSFTPSPGLWCSPVCSLVMFYCHNDGHNYKLPKGSIWKHRTPVIFKEQKVQLRKKESNKQENLFLLYFFLFPCLLSLLRGFSYSHFVKRTTVLEALYKYIIFGICD